MGQRIFGLVLGYEDLNDHDELRKDPTFGVLTGKLHPVLRSDCEALAGKSTLNVRAHAQTPYSSRSITGSIVTGHRLTRCWSSFSWRRMSVRRARSLDLDNTDIPLHGAQEGRFFHGYDVLLPAALRVLRPASAAGPAAACVNVAGSDGVDRRDDAHHRPDPPEDVAARAHRPPR